LPSPPRKPGPEAPDPTSGGAGDGSRAVAGTSALSARAPRRRRRRWRRPEPAQSQVWPGAPREAPGTPDVPDPGPAVTRISRNCRDRCGRWQGPRVWRSRLEGRRLGRNLASEAQQRRAREASPLGPAGRGRGLGPGHAEQHEEHDAEMSPFHAMIPSKEHSISTGVVRTCPWPSTWQTQGEAGRVRNQPERRR